MLMISENEFFHEIKCDRITSLHGIHDTFLFLYLNSQEGKWAEDKNEIIWQNILAEQ